jgi:steroid delta-isomerase-like uncharacterized protein
MSKRNVELAHRWFEEVWNNRHLEVIDEMASPDALGEGQLHHGAPINIEQFRQFAREMQNAFPQLHLKIEDTIASGDRVVIRWHTEMVHEGTFMGVAGTGRKVSLTGITILRFAKGKIVQGWDNWDQLGLLAQIGAVPGRFAPVAA